MNRFPTAFLSLSLVLSLGVGFAMAQTSGGAVETSVNQTGVAASATTTDSQDGNAATDGQAVVRPTLGSEEMISRADAIVANGKELSLSLQSRLDQAKSRGGDAGPDIVLIECLNEKIDQVNRRVGDRGTLTPHVTKLKAAAENGDDEAREFEFALVEIVGQELDDLERDAGLCTGDEQFFASESTQVTTDIAEQMPANAFDSNVLVTPPAGGDQPPSAIDGPPPPVSLASPAI